MPTSNFGRAPTLSTFIHRTLKQDDIETCIDQLSALLKRRQIKNARECATATAHLILRIVRSEKVHDSSSVIIRIRSLGRRLAAAQPQELAVGNIVRRILAVVREVVEDEINAAEESEMESSQASLATSNSTVTATESTTSPEATSSPARPESTSQMSHSGQLRYSSRAPRAKKKGRPPTGDIQAVIKALATNTKVQIRPPYKTSISYSGETPEAPAMLKLLDQAKRSPSLTPSSQSPRHSIHTVPTFANKDFDLKGEIVNGIQDLLEEVSINDLQIAENAFDYIHAGDTILTHTTSRTLRKFLLMAAHELSFTVIFVTDTSTARASREIFTHVRPLIQHGTTVVVVPETAVFAIMSRVTKVLLAPNTVLADGSLLAAAGANTMATVARAQRVPVLVLSGVYKLSPKCWYDAPGVVVELGSPGQVSMTMMRGCRRIKGLMRVPMINPLTDWVDGDLVDLYVTNLGGCARTFLHRVVEDHYSQEDYEL